MDLWDIAKLLWRRRWMSLPLILLTVYLSAYVAATTTPDYKTTGHVVLLAPTEAKPTTAAPGPVTSSPWTPWSISDALVIYLQRADIKTQFADAGLSEEWTASVGGSGNPIIELEVVGHTQPQASDTLSRLVTVLAAKLSDMQEPYDVHGRQGITAQGVDIGQNNEVVTSKVKRIVIVVAAVGLLMTAGLTIWLDAILRRQGRRRAGVAPLSPPVRVPHPSPADPGVDLVVSRSPARVSEQRVTFELDAVPASQRRTSVDRPAPANGSESAPSPRPPDVDTTIILPLSYSRRNGSETEQGPGRS